MFVPCLFSLYVLSQDVDVRYFLEQIRTRLPRKSSISSYSVDSLAFYPVDLIGAW